MKGQDFSEFEDSHDPIFPVAYGRLSAEQVDLSEDVWEPMDAMVGELTPPLGLKIGIHL